jgi:poly-D-alanine transfer protein DltD
MASIDLTLETLAPSKLLNYMQKDRLIEFISPTRYADLEQRLRQQLNKSNVNLKELKKQLATRPKLMQSLRHSAGSSATVKHRQIQVVGHSKGRDATPKSLPRLSGWHRD